MRSGAAAIGLGLAGFGWGGGGAGTAQAADAKVFVLQRDGADVKLTAEAIGEGGVQVYPGTAESGVIAVILPVGPGGSGGMYSLAPQRLITIRHADGQLHMVERVSGKEHPWPARAVEELDDCDVRVCVIGGDGANRAFLIRKVPIQPGDYLVATETTPGEVGPVLRGSIACEFDRYFFATARRADGVEAPLAIDTGAGGTCLRQTFLPEGAAIEPSQMARYSGGVKDLLPTQFEGATGTAPTIAGITTLPLTLGGLDVGRLTVAVLTQLEPLAGREAAGIGGLDLLRRGGRARFVYPASETGPAAVQFGAALPSDGAAEIPMAVTGKQIFLQAEFDGQPFKLLVDTGAPVTILDDFGVEAAGLKTDERPAIEIGGGDGGRATARGLAVREVRLGERRLADPGVRAADMAVFHELRGRAERVGLLGNDVLRRLGWIEFDFERRVARFPKP
jgi:hypothetical protein